MISPRYRYGLFLRPPARLARIQAETHLLLRAQYGLVSAGAFPPHMTILGHVATEDDHEPVIDAAHIAMKDVAPVRIFNHGLTEHHGGIVHDVGRLRDGSPNPTLLDLFRRARTHLDPLRVPLHHEFKGGVKDDDAFYGHMTLAGHDLAARPELFAEVYDFLSQLDIDARGDYIADTITLYAFETTSGWDGPWWETMTWTVLASIRLS